jgi:hypothetical protein
MTKSEPKEIYKIHPKVLAKTATAALLMFVCRSVAMRKRLMTRIEVMSIVISVCEKWMSDEKKCRLQSYIFYLICTSESIKKWGQSRTLRPLGDFV